MNSVPASSGPTGDLEAGRQHTDVALKLEQRSNIRKYLIKANGVFMVVLSICPILLYEEIKDAKADAARLLFDLSPTAIFLAYRFVLAFWLATFILQVLKGSWRKLKGYQRKCHRLLFIGLLMAALIAKMIVPDQIQLSFVPIAITILAEATYILIDLTCALLSKISRHFQNIWAVVKEWFRFRLVIGGAMG